MKVIADKLNYRDCITHLCNGVAFNAILLIASGAWRHIPFPLNYGGFDSALLMFVVIPVLYIESHLVLSIDTIVYDVFLGKLKDSRLVKLYCRCKFVFCLLFGSTVRGQRVLQFRYYNTDFSVKNDKPQYDKTEESVALYKAQKEWIRERSRQTELTTRDNTLFGLFKGIKIDALIGVLVSILYGSGVIVTLSCLLIFLLAWAREFKYGRLCILNRISQCRKHSFKEADTPEQSPTEKK